MNFRTLALLFFALLIVGIGVSVWVGKQQLAGLQQQTAQQQTDQQQMAGDIISDDITLTVTNGPAKQWELKAKQATYNRSRTEADLTTVTGQFFGDDGKPVAYFKAPTGHYNDDTKAVTLTGNVLVTKADDEHMGLQAPTVTWSSKTKMVDAAGGVKVFMGENLESRGQTCQFTLDFNTIRLSGSAFTEMDMG